MPDTKDPVSPEEDGPAPKRSRIRSEIEVVAELKSLLYDLTRLVSDWVWETDPDFKLTYVSSRVTEVLSFHPYELLGRRLVDLGAFVSEGGGAFEPEWRAPFRDVLFRMADRDSRERLFLVSGLPVFDEKTEAFRGVRGTARDITRRKEAEDALKESEERFRTIVEQAPEATVLIDVDTGKFVEANENAQRLFGMSRDRLLAVGPVDVSPPVQPDGTPSKALVRENFEALARRPLPVFEWTFRDSAGRNIPCEIRLVRFSLAGRTVIRGSLIDITERKKVEWQLQAAKEEAEQASAAKTRFLAAASHDLRQPLQALNLFVSVLADKEDDADKSAVIEKIERSLEALQGLVDSLLDISKLEAGLVAAERRDVPLGLVLKRLEEEFAPLAQAKGLDLRCVATDAVVHTDPSLLEAILRNLLSNAFRYTESGRVLLGCRRRGPDVRVEVWDTGEGIPDDQQRLIFEEFYQVGNDARDHRQGLGLGLSIVDRLAKLLGHPIEVSSVPGKGSVFSIAVPLASPGAAVAPDGPAAPGEDLNGAFILVIDDDRRILDGMSMLLKAWGCRVLAVPSLDCEPARRLLAGGEPRPDLVIVDYRLRHGVKGTNVITALKKALKREIPAVILTGETAPDRLRGVKESGFALLHKPVQPSTLRALLAEILDSGEKARGRDPSARADPA